MHVNSFDGKRKLVLVSRMTKGADVWIDFWVGYRAIGVLAG